jgi:hypothetical protein
MPLARQGPEAAGNAFATPLKLHEDQSESHELWFADQRRR